MTSKTVMEAAAALADKMPKGPALSAFHAYAEVMELRRALKSAASETSAAKCAHCEANLIPDGPGRFIQTCSCSS